MPEASRRTVGAFLPAPCIPLARNFYVALALRLIRNVVDRAKDGGIGPRCYSMAHVRFTVLLNRHLLRCVSGSYFNAGRYLPLRPFIHQ